MMYYELLKKKTSEIKIALVTALPLAMTINAAESGNAEAENACKEAYNLIKDWTQEDADNDFKNYIKK